MKAASSARVDVACSEALEVMVPEIASWCARLADAELQASQDTVAVDGVRPEANEALKTGSLRMLRDEIEFAESRIERLR